MSPKCTSKDRLSEDPEEPPGLSPPSRSASPVLFVLKPLLVGAAGSALQTPRQSGGGVGSNLLRCPGGRNPVLVLDAPLDQAWFPGQQGPVRPQSSLLERVPPRADREPSLRLPSPGSAPRRLTAPRFPSPLLCAHPSTYLQFVSKCTLSFLIEEII